MELILSTNQKLLMSQKMLQSTEILQMSSTELLDYIKDVSVENPLFDFIEKESEDEKFSLLRKKLEYLDASDEQNRIYYSEEKVDEDNNDNWKFKENIIESLESYLLEQVNVLQEPKHIVCVCRYIVGCINEQGYLQESVNEIGEALKIDVCHVEKALGIVQGFEPAGVGGRDLKECLYIQLDRLEQDNNVSVAKEIIENSLEMVGKNQIHLIAKKLKVCCDTISNAIALIKTLNPKPGNCFHSGTALEYIVPDVIINETEKGFEIVLNDKLLPDIGINSYYKTILDMNDDKSTRDYISNKVRQVEWIMTCISKRNSTLTKTIESILNIQESFFKNGVGNLNPMRLCDIATAIDMHESTVSRSIKQKYLQCRHGVFPLSYFFQSCVSSSSCEATTPEKIKILIKEIIDNENSASPYSDREVTEKLTEQGIEISRRTVAKYRESMGILGTSGRKIK